MYEMILKKIMRVKKKKTNFEDGKELGLAK